MLEALRTAVKRTMEIHEASWDQTDPDDSRYTIEREQAAVQACREAGLDTKFAPLIWLALAGAANDVQAWAEGEYDGSFDANGDLIDGPTMAEKHAEAIEHATSREHSVEKLAREFASNIRTSMVECGTPGDIEEMLRLNREETDPKVCHTHDYMDANMEMAQAFLDVFGIQADPQLEEHARLWNDAWALAQRNEFWVAR